MLRQSRSQDELRLLQKSPPARMTPHSSKGNGKVVEERQKDDADETRTKQHAEGKSGGHRQDTKANPPPDLQRS